MRSFGLILVSMGLCAVGFGFILPTNEYMESGVRFGQDCDGPGTVIALLSLGLLSSILGLAVMGFKAGWRSLKTEKFALGASAVTVFLLCLKVPEVKQELDHNAGSGSSCTMDQLD